MRIPGDCKLIRLLPLVAAIGLLCQPTFGAAQAANPDGRLSVSEVTLIDEEVSGHYVVTGTLTVTDPATAALHLLVNIDQQAFRMTPLRLLI